jgi:hypothetical protein
MADVLFLRTGSSNCPTCGREAQVTVLPALYKAALPQPPPLPEEPPAPGEAVCYHNPKRRATKVCDHCGVFVSDAWAAKWGHQTVCLKCIEGLRSEHKDIRFEAKRKLWDNVALLLSVGPWVLAMLLIATFFLYVFGFLSLMLTLVTAPASIFIALRYWNAPRSLAPRGRGRLIWALGLSSLQVCLWVAGFLMLAAQWNEL